MDDGQYTRRQFLQTGGALAAALSPRTSWSAEITKPKGIGKVYVVGGVMTTPREGKLLPEDPQEALEYCDPHHILRRICEDSDAAHRQIMIINCGSSPQKKEGEKESPRERYTREYLEEFALAGAKNIVMIDSIEDVLSQRAVDAANDPNTSLVKLGAGDQWLKTAEVRYGLSLKDYQLALEHGETPKETEFYKALMKRIHKKDIMVAGNSAGATAVSGDMPYGKQFCIKGFEILNWCVVDTHANRKKYNGDELVEWRKGDRIIEALNHPNNRSNCALALDESVCAIIDLDHPEVETFGHPERGTYFLDKGDTGKFVRAGERYTMKQHPANALMPVTSGISVGR